jgi:predicted DNA-binding WGR domain protein
MPTLRSSLIRLAHQNPDLRPHLLPLLVDRMAGMQVRMANKPILEKEGLNTAAVAAGLGAMLYFIDAAKNHSKGYEMLIVPESNTAVLIRRWGALTDTGATGRFEEKKEFYPNVPAAQAAMAKIYREKVGKGYRDAYNRKMHVSPVDGKPLPLGQYPVGLTRTVGFGWGTQSATRCIPSLRTLQEKIDGALLELSEDKDLADILADMEGADRIINALMRNPEAVDTATNRSMGDLLAAMLGPAMRRIKALQGTPVSRILPDLAKLRSELVAIRNYLTRQLSYCS